jgi:hypothetical protein
MLIFVRILWHRVDELVPRFPHRENFAVLCEDFVAMANERMNHFFLTEKILHIFVRIWGRKVVPLFSRRKKLSRPV